MALGTFFSGNALRAVDAEGRTVLPPFILSVLERRCAGSRLVFGAHESDPCVSGYDEAYEAKLFEDMERRRLREEGQGVPAAAHHSRARRLFGIVERSAFDAEGRITLPPMIRRRGRIRDRALFVGTGGSFEIWDPELAREAGGEELRELVEFAVAGEAAGEESEVEQ
ncbi:MAG: hypothetical protein M3177_07045 [Pseudomonadota bacterium]|nr:hypothetical protein [Pseudomonadota bacterium]